MNINYDNTIDPLYSIQQVKVIGCKNIVFIYYFFACGHAWLPFLFQFCIKCIDQMNNRPIGIFDSGIGGLTLAKTITDLMPHESIVYFGDTAHLPYGDKSAAAIQAYSVKICDMLLKHDCKIILIACNSASAAAYELVKEYVGKRVPVVNVIDPVAMYVAQKFTNEKIGLIGTKQTINSGEHIRKIHELNAGLEVAALATPLLAPMIEEGFFSNSVAQSVINEYLSHPQLEGIRSLILGCTHYPLIMDQISEFYNYSIEIIDYTRIVALHTFNLMKEMNMEAALAPGEVPELKFFVSDYTRSFEQSTKLFFARQVSLVHYPLWE